MTTIQSGGRATPGQPARQKRRAGVAQRALTGALRTRRGQIGAVLTVFVLLVAILGPELPHRSATGFTTFAFAPAGSHGAGLLGGDNLGRDVLARVLTGGGGIILISLIATVLTIVLGTAAGVTAAYRRGVTEQLVMRTVDIVLALPQLVFILVMVSVIGPKEWLIIVCVGLSQAPATARVIYAAAQDVCERDFVKAVAVWGVPSRTVVQQQVLPNLLTPLMVEAGLRFGYSVILVAGLNFLGLGSQSGGANWGVMIQQNELGMTTNPWGVLAPAILLAILSVGVNMFTDAIARASLGNDQGDRLFVAVTSGAGVDG